MVCVVLDVASYDIFYSCTAPMQNKRIDEVIVSAGS